MLARGKECLDARVKCRLGSNHSGVDYEGGRKKKRASFEALELASATYLNLLTFTVGTDPITGAHVIVDGACG